MSTFSAGFVVVIVVFIFLLLLLMRMSTFSAVFLLLFCFGDFESNRVMSAFSAIVYCFFFYFWLVRSTMFTFSEGSCAVFIVGPLSRVRPRNGILALVVLVVVVVLPLRSEFIGEL